MTRLGILLGLVAVLVAIAWHLRPGEPWSGPDPLPITDDLDADELLPEGR